MMNKLTLITLLFILGTNGDNLHGTPPMGWSSWNTFFNEIDEAKVLGNAEAIKRLKLDTLGYIYVTIDDFWNLPDRDAKSQRMLTNTTRFPNGMPYVGQVLHQLGLKFGLYSDAGVKTCGGMAGSLNYEAIDLDQFLGWDIDYLKYDNCFPTDDDSRIHNINVPESLIHLPSFYQSPSEEERFSRMGEQILAAKNKKNITVELCLYGWGNVETWGFAYAQLWRTSQDIRDEWKSVLQNIDRNDEKRFQLRQGPLWGWNYPDALFVGKGGMSLTEYRTMFTLWCIVKSPLMLGTDLRNMQATDEAYKIITNTDLLDINQDPMGIQATCVKNCCSHDGDYGGIDSLQTCPGFSNSWQIWSGPLANSSFVLVFLNRYDVGLTNVTFDLNRDGKIPPGTYRLKDLWNESLTPPDEVVVGNASSNFTISNIEPHAVRALRFDTK